MHAAAYVVRRIVSPRIAGLSHCEVSELAEDLTLKRKDRKSQHIQYIVDDFSDDQWRLCFVGLGDLSTADRR